MKLMGLIFMKLRWCSGQTIRLSPRDVARTFKGGGGSPADTNNYDRFDAPIALNTREV